MYANLNSFKTWALDNNTLYIIVYDEDANNTTNNNIPCIFYGPMVKGGTYTENATLYSLLRTIENMYSLPYAGSASSVTTITDCWRTSGTGSWLGVNKTTTNNYRFKVMPNPATDMITFNCNNTLKTP